MAVIGSASGSGKTTFGRELARRLDVQFVELDALHHGPDWTEATAEELRTKVEPIVEQEAWVIDGAYMGKLGHLVVGSADVVVWLDPPVRVWLPRLLRRTFGRVLRREALWNENRESLRTALFTRDSVIWFSLLNYRRRRRLYPERLVAYRVVRLQSQAQVTRFLEEARA